MLRPLLLTILFLAGCLFATSPAKAVFPVPSGDSGQSDQGEDYPRDEPGDVARGDDGSDESEEEERPPVPPGCIRIGDQVSCPRSEGEVAAELIAEGPQVSPPRDDRRYSVTGFIRDGWPVVVDFQPEPNTRTYLEIHLYDGGWLSLRDARIILDPNGQGGRQVFQGEIAFPRSAQAADRPVRVANIYLVSRRLRANGRMSRQRAPVQLFGLGAGPSALAADYGDEEEPEPLEKPNEAETKQLNGGSGSFSVADVILAEGSTNLQMPASRRVRVGYQYRLRQRFRLVSEDLWRLCGSCGRPLSAQRRVDPRGRLSHEVWLERPGRYRLDVRAWVHCGSADFRQCADEAAWATGRAGPLLVTE